MTSQEDPRPMEIDKDTFTTNEIKSIVEAFFKEPENSRGDLLDYFNKYGSNFDVSNQKKSQEMIEINAASTASSQKNPPGNAVSVDPKPPKPPEKSGRTEAPSKDKNEKESKDKLLQDRVNDSERNLREENEILKEHKNELVIKFNDVVNKYNYLFENKAKLENKVNQLENKASQLEYKANQLENKANQLENDLLLKRTECQELRKRNEELRDEASQYQSALGDAKNYRLGDSDVNNPIQLIQDIEIIQEKINEFCKIKGGIGVIEIDEKNQKNLTSLLSEKYKCKLELGDKLDKVLAKNALQRLIFETIMKRTEDYLEKSEIDDFQTIMEKTEDYLEKSENDDFQTIMEKIEDYLEKSEIDDKFSEKYLESEIFKSTTDYSRKLKKLISSRIGTGTDEVSSAAPIKIRQLVYAVFGDRAFGLGNNNNEHEFVQKLKNEIIDKMNEFRKIKNDDKIKENEEMLAEIIKNVIKMFNFRIKVLEPQGEIKWFSEGDPVDPSSMELGNLEDENYEDWIVNLCYFPLIGVNLESKTDRKVLFQAKIVPIKKKKGIKHESKALFGNILSRRANSTDPRMSNKPSTGTDEVISAASKEIHQLVYSVLGGRAIGFNNNYIESLAAPIKIHQLVDAVFRDRAFGLNNNNNEHEFVQKLKDEIIVKMNEYRKIKKEDKRKENKKILEEIIKSVIKMFIFRIKVLEPQGEIKWFSEGNPIDPSSMKLGNLEGEDWIVNLCYFPLIGVNLESKTDRKVLVQAKIKPVKKKMFKTWTNS